MLRTANPALREQIFENAAATGFAESTMTIVGTARKAGILLLLVILTAGFTWRLFYGAADAVSGAAEVMPWMMVGIIGGLIVAIVTIFKREWAMITAPIYALLEGLALGGISSIFEEAFPGIVMPAVGLTFGTLAVMLIIYANRWIQVTEKFRIGIVAATGAICLVYLATFVMNLFGTTIPYIHSGGPIGIIFSVVVIVIAALNLVLDFDLIERGSEMGAPKYMEWYGAFGLMVTLIWLYLEFLRLLAKMRQR